MLIRRGGGAAAARRRTPGPCTASKKCEICKLKLARRGKDGKKRWCAGCAKVHVGAVNVV